MKYLLSITLLFLAISSCTKKIQGPESLLKAFVKAQFNRKLSRTEVEDYLAGEMLESIQNMDDEGYKVFNDLSAYKLKDIEINLKRCDEQKCFITYTLSYLKRADKKTSFLIFVKKIAEIRTIAEKDWRIFNVNNIKTYVDSKKVIDVTGKK